MSETWDNRYSTSTFVYGTEPNVFFKEVVLQNTPGKILLPADGEGRNSVYAASIGYDVHAFDFSLVAIEKARQLATARNVTVKYKHADFNVADKLYPDNSFDYLALIYTHLPPEVRKLYHNMLLRKLKPGGKLIFEAFSKKQMHRTSGGPKIEELLYLTDDLRRDFGSLSKLSISENEIVLDEGELHNGAASVIRIQGVK
ncbi:MAG TPA: class I SAM-dependent methyltransferase [Bacteroidales bacterium]|nr:class I SAM-dependent methyltransferase [Bacteroidales bacterium]